MPSTYLSIREPALEQLDTYFKYRWGDISWPDNYHGLSKDTILIYEDVSGDNEPDLIVDDSLHVMVMVWVGDRYGEPFWITHPRWKYDPGSRTFLEDWTGDGVPEVIFDYRGDSGGTGFLETWWERNIIHCREDRCNLAWVGWMGGYISDVNWGGHYLGRVDLRLILDETETPILRHFHEGFKIFCCSLIELEVEDSNPDHIHLLESGVTRYRWDGSAFVKMDYQATRLLKVIEPKPTYKASGPDGVLAEITYEFNGYVSPANDVCQLHIAGESVGPRFGCKRAHVSIEWKDITSDGIDEIIVTTFSGPFPYDRDGTVLSDEEFPHQRLMAYQWVGDEMMMIANISGFVVEDDLYGVRLEDYDSDGQLEILAAGGFFSPPEGCHKPEYQAECWYELSYHNVIYEWDGERFVNSQAIND